jgi:hypothetical protein
MDPVFLHQFNTDHPELLVDDGKHKLEDTWVLWSHAADNPSWKIDAYRRHCEISTVEGFWHIFNLMRSLINRDIWLLMRKGIPPLWEDPINAEGGSFKFRVPGDEADNCWLALCMHAVTENMCLKKSDAAIISGISLSPKGGGYCTISVWNLDCTHTKHAIFPSNVGGDFGNKSRYQAHKSRPCG